MPYLNCHRCGLEIKIQAAFLRIENCPRCLARTATSVPLALTAEGGAGDFGGDGKRALQPRLVDSATRVASEAPRERRPS